MLSQKMKFNQAKLACQAEGSVLAMPRTVEDISDIKEFDCEYSVMKWVSDVVTLFGIGQNYTQQPVNETQYQQKV